MAVEYWQRLVRDFDKAAVKELDNNYREVNPIEDNM